MRTIRLQERNGCSARGDGRTTAPASIHPHRDAMVEGGRVSQGNEAQGINKRKRLTRNADSRGTRRGNVSGRGREAHEAAGPDRVCDCQ